MREVGTGEGHGGSGTGYCNVYSSATANNPYIEQNILTAHRWYDFTIVIDTDTSGELLVLDPNGWPTNFSPVLGTSRRIVRKGAVGNRVRIRGSASPPTDNTIESFSAKEIDLDTCVALLSYDQDDVWVHIDPTITDETQAGLILRSSATSTLSGAS